MSKEVREMSKKPGGSSGLVWPCAACKLLRRRCAQDCIFAPYFPANEPQKFANVHKVFGASNVNKLLQIFSHFILCSFACLVLTVQANSKALRKGDIGDNAGKYTECKHSK